MLDRVFRLYRVVSAIEPDANEMSALNETYTSWQVG